MSSQALSQRFVGIRPRVKKTASGEARPTQVAIVEGDRIFSYDLGSEQEELDFVLGVFPIGYRKVADGEDISKVRPHHIVLDGDDKPSKVPSGYDGLRKGDVVAMVLGGSGDYLAFALSRKGEGVAATVLRVPPFILAHERGDEGDKSNDAEFLARLAQAKPGLFTPVYVRDRAIVRVREHQRQRIDTMKARIGCEQRLRQAFIGRIFCTPDGLFPEGAIEKEFDEAKANDVVLGALSIEEKRANRELAKAVEDTHVWQEVLSKVEGLGPAIGARLISVIQDIRRFETAPKLRKYLGVHVQEDGRFPRRRVGELAGWSNEGRQALYLIIDQFNRRPGSDWGVKFLENKAFYQAKYPYPHLAFKRDGVEEIFVLEPGKFERQGTKYILELDGVQVDITGKMRHFKGHLHKMAGWRTASQFVNWLFGAWWDLEHKLAMTTEPKATEGDGEVAA